jgi:hypothetical protein
VLRNASPFKGGNGDPLIHNLGETVLSQLTIERERRKLVFTINHEVHYKLLYGQRSAESGVGNTITMSSKCVLLSTDTELVPGMPIELSISWPVLLDDRCPMKLMIHGCVLECNDNIAAVTIERHQFRTRRRHLD